MPDKDEHNPDPQVITLYVGSNMGPEELLCSISEAVQDKGIQVYLCLREQDAS
jgi:hypothetical protein